MKPDAINWNEMKAEVVSAEIVNVEAHYQVLVRYKYLVGGSYQYDEYKSRLLVSESLAKSYADAALKVACPPEQAF